MTVLSWAESDRRGPIRPTIAGMGETQTTKRARDAAERAAVAALQPLITAAVELAEAQFAAGQANTIREQAEQRVAQIRAEAEAEIAQRNERWRSVYAATVDVGWTPKELRGEPLNLRRPPASARKPKNGAAPSRPENAAATAEVADSDGPGAGSLAHAHDPIAAAVA
jgi:hypothetical protein